MKLTALIAFFLFALVATWFASVPQATMLLARPVYLHFAPDLVAPGPDMVWIANIVWTPIAGTPMSVAYRHDWPIAIAWLFSLWAFVGTPVAGGLLATWLLRISTDKSRSVCAQRMGRCGFALWIVSLFVAFRIPPEVPVEFGFWWSTY